MANGLEGELKTFLADTKGMKKGSPDYNARVETFNQSCQKNITENLEGVSRKSSFFNFIAPAVNGFLKAIGLEPYKLDTTAFAKNQDIKDALRTVKDTGIAKDNIEKVEEGNEPGPGM